ncbi:hypothetical protein NKG05_05820 [Oerskovia sp. M15]
MTSWYPLTDGEPIPGTPDVVRTGARRMQRVAEAMTNAHTSLGRIASNDGQSSDAVDELREKAQEIRKEILKAQGGTRRSATRWSPTPRSTARRSRRHALSSPVPSQPSRRSTRPPGAVPSEREARRGEGRVAANGRAGRLVDRDLCAQRGHLAHRRRGVVDRRQGELPEVIEAWRAAASAARSVVERVVESDGLNDGWWEKWGRASRAGCPRSSAPSRRCSGCCRSCWRGCPSWGRCSRSRP